MNGQPTENSRMGVIIAIWEGIVNEIRILEVTYVGSREDAPY